MDIAGSVNYSDMSEEEFIQYQLKLMEETEKLKKHPDDDVFEEIAEIQELYHYHCGKGVNPEPTVES